MASDGASKDYKFGQKNNWRRAVWNDVLSRTKGREKRECILYLAGPQDLDRTVAMSKGVPGVNLVAIDRAGANVTRARKSGGVAIQGDIHDVLWNWPESRPVCAVLLDFCCGLEVSAAFAMEAVMTRPSMRGVVMMANFMRGRDPSTNKLRSLMASYGDEGGSYLGVCARHRGLQALQLCWVNSMRRRGKPVEEWKRSVWVEFIGRHSPVFRSYRSGPLVMDSVVCQSGVAPEWQVEWLAQRQQRRDEIDAARAKIAKAKGLGVDTSELEASLDEWERDFAASCSKVAVAVEEYDQGMREWRRLYRSNKTVRSRISAAMALRTMRQNGTWPQRKAG